MATMTITVSDGAAQRLELLRAEYNLRNGTALTLRAWLELHLRELAISRELAGTSATIGEQAQRQAELDLAAALQAERDRLLGLV